MKRFLDFFRRVWRVITYPARKAAIFIVTSYANRQYTKAVNKADKWHEESNKIIYVTSGLFAESKLMVTDGDGFRKIKKRANLKGDKYPIRTFRKYGCWYHTADKLGRFGMTDKEKEVKRLAFIKLMLIEAKLIDSVDPMKYSRTIRLTK